MAITLIVEDGSGRSDANAIVSLAEAKAYWDGRGTSYAAYTDEVLNAAIVRASDFLANAYVWQGRKINLRAQTMPFPRYAVTDRENWPVLPNEIPREVKAACCEIALFEAATPGAINPTVVQSEKVRSEQIGSIRVEYANLFNSASDTRPVLLIVNDLLWPFLGAGAGQYLSGRADRV
jgi:hypothetical protein